MGDFCAQEKSFWEPLFHLVEFWFFSFFSMNNWKMSVLSEYNNNGKTDLYDKRKREQLGLSQWNQNQNKTKIKWDCVRPLKRKRKGKWTEASHLLCLSKMFKYGYEHVLNHSSLCGSPLWIQMTQSWAILRKKSTRTKPQSQEGHYIRGW